MVDRRIEELGDIIVNHSCDIQQGERVLIESSRTCAPLIKHIVKLIFFCTLS